MSREGKPSFGIFNDGFPPIIDGVTQAVLNYVDWFREKGYDPSVVTTYNPEKFEVPYNVIRYFSLPIPSRKPYRYGYPKLDPFIWKKLRETKFDLVHSHSPFAAGRLAVYTKKKQGIPLIGTFHSKYKVDLKHSFRHAPWCVPIIMKRILNFYNACDEVWIPQASVEETVREYGFKGKLEVVENGIDFGAGIPSDLKTFKTESRKELGIGDDEIALLFVGQHIWEKGIGIIADALALLPDDVKFRMTFIGEGYAKKELEEKILKAGLLGKVKFIDLLTDRELLRKHYAASDLFLFPSRYDNAPLVVREAASMATPAVIPLDSTASEVIQDGINGFLVEDTPQAYAETIERLSKNREAIAAAGETARNTLVRDWNDVMLEVEDRYLKLLKRKG